MFTVPLQRHVTRQKILNWKQSLRFPSRPRVSHEAINLMEQLLCEPEDRLGSQASASVSRPNSMIIQARRSGFMAPVGSAGSGDGASLIKVQSSPVLTICTATPDLINTARVFFQAHPWFRGIDWLNIHRYPAPYRPELHNPEDTRHFDADIPAEVFLDFPRHLLLQRVFSSLIGNMKFSPLHPRMERLLMPRRIHSYETRSTGQRSLTSVKPWLSLDLRTRAHAR